MILPLMLFGCIAQQRVMSIEVQPPSIKMLDLNNDSYEDMGVAVYPPVNLGPVKLWRYVVAYPIPQGVRVLPDYTKYQSTCANAKVYNVPSEYLKKLRSDYVSNLRQAQILSEQGRLDEAAQALALTCGNELHFLYKQCPCLLAQPFSDRYYYTVLLVLEPTNPFLSLSVEDIVQVHLLPGGISVRAYPEISPSFSGQSIRWQNIPPNGKIFLSYTIRSDVKPSALIFQKWPPPSIGFTMLPYSNVPWVRSIYEFFDSVYHNLAPLGHAAATAITLGIAVFLFFEIMWFLSFLYFLLQSVVSPETYEANLKSVMGKENPQWKILLLVSVGVFIVSFFVAGHQPLRDSIYDVFLEANAVGLSTLMIVPMALAVILLLSVLDSLVKGYLYRLMLPPKVKKVEIIKDLVNRGKELSTRARRLGIDFVDEYETILTTPVNIEDQSEIDRSIEKLTQAINTLKQKVITVESNLPKWLEEAKKIKQKKGEVSGEDLQHIPPEWRRWVLERLSEKEKGVVIGESFVPKEDGTKPMAKFEMDLNGNVLEDQLPRGVKRSYVRVALYRLNNRIGQLVSKVGGEPQKVYLFGRGLDVGIKFLPSSLRVLIAEDIKKILGK